MKKNLLKTISLGLVLSMGLVAVGCKKDEAKGTESVEADKAGMSMEAKEPGNETFKPSDYTIEGKDQYTYEYLGLNFKLANEILKDMKDKDIAMLDDQSPVDEELKYALLSFSEMTDEQKNAELSKMGDDYPKWVAGLKRLGTIGMFKKGMTEEEISKITMCSTHQNLGTSSDGEYEYYLSFNRDDDDFVKEFQNTEVNIIEKLPVPENGFVLAEKTDLEGTVPYGGQSVEDLSSVVTKDIMGNEFSSKDFANSELTMVNVFATWCTACIKEIPDLVELQKEMKDKGVNIVGIVTDTVDDKGENADAIAKSKEIMEKTKANYPFLMPDATQFNGRLIGIQALPETFFVNKEGKIVGDTYLGSRNLKDWKEVVEKELANLNK